MVVSWKTGNLFFWRDQSGTEIDLLEDQAGRLTPTEIKSGATFAADWLRNIKRWQSYAAPQADPGRIVYTGNETFTHDGVTVTPWFEF